MITEAFKVSDVVKLLLMGATPERKEEISALWDCYAIKADIIKDVPGANIKAPRKSCIQFDYKSLECIWLFGFNGWRSIETYSPAVMMAGLTGGILEEILGIDDELAIFEMDYKSRSNIARSIIEGQGNNQIAWPPDIPRPEANRNALGNHQEMAAFDLVCLATAYVFLHELRHVKYLGDGDCPADPREEEIACDVWARSFLTDKIGVYAQSVGQPYAAVLEKRSMGIALGAMILHEITPVTARWGTSAYPPIVKRIQAMISGCPLPIDSHYWLFTACLLVGIFRKEHRKIPLHVASSKMLAEKLTTCLFA